MSPTVRPAREDDLPAIWAIYNEAVLHTTASWDLEPVPLGYITSLFETRRRAGHPMLVADEDGGVLGYATYGQFRAKPGYSRTMEHSVYVDASARGKGVGRMLLQSIIDAARTAGVHVLIGGLDAANEVSMRLHQSLGFVEVGRLPQVGAKFGHWLDLVFLELLLDEAVRP